MASLEGPAYLLSPELVIPLTIPMWRTLRLEFPAGQINHSQHFLDYCLKPAMAAQTMSETRHISRERFLRRLQWVRSSSRQGTIRAALLRSRNCSLAMESSPRGKVGRLVTSELKIGCCMVALASLSTEQPREMICPVTPGGTVETPRSSLRHRDSS